MKITFSRHARLESMPKRGISEEQVREALLNPVQYLAGAGPGTHEVHGRIADGRLLSVVYTQPTRDHRHVVTTYWV